MKKNKMGEFKEKVKKDLISFTKDKTVYDSFDWVELKGSQDVLVKFFKYEDVKNEFRDNFIMQDKLTGAFSTADKELGSWISNMALVIKSNDEQYKKGDVITVPSKKVEGEDYTPDYMMLRQFANSNMDPILPPGFREKAPRLELNYATKMVKNPLNREETEEDRLIYILHRSDIVYTVNVKKL